MEISVQLEKPSQTVRKLTITVPATHVDAQIQTHLNEAQKKAKMKGFRPGHVPMNVVKQQYGKEVLHDVLHQIIDSSFRKAVTEHQLRTVSQPRLSADGKGKKTDHEGHGHDGLSVEEGKDFTYVAEVEVLPEVEAKTYKGLSVTQDSATVKDEEIDQVIKGLQDSRAELIPLLEDRPIQKGDHVDFEFDGGLVTATGIEKKEGMKGTHMTEVGAGQFIPGFEEEMIGVKAGGSKTFRIKFPEDYGAKDFAGQQAEFSIKINEVKKKKLPELTEAFAKELGYENVEDMKKKAREYLEQNRQKEVDQKLQNDILQALIDQNPFELPPALIEAQTRHLVQEYVQQLRQQRLNDEMIQEMIQGDLENIRKKAENQVRAGLLLESVSKKEKIEVKPEEVDAEIETIAQSMKGAEDKVREFYKHGSERRENLEFRMKEDRAVKILLDQAKIKKK